MRKCFLLLSMIAFAELARAQTSAFGLIPFACYSRDIDSLHRLLRTEKLDTAKATLCNLLAREYNLMGKTDSVVYYSQLALQLAEKSNYIKGKIDARSWQIKLQEQFGNYPNALELALDNLRLAEQTKDSIVVFEALRGVSFTYSGTKDPKTLLEYNRRTRRLIHSGIFKEERDIKAYSFTGYLNWIAGAFRQLNRYDSALYYRRLAYETARYFNDDERLAIAAGNLGGLYAVMGQKDSAYPYTRMALAHAQKVPCRTDLVANAYMGMARFFRLNGQIDSSIHYGRLSLLTAQRLKIPDKELTAASFLKDLYAQQQRMDSAFKYLEMSAALKDSMFSKEKIVQVLNIRFEETLLQQQLEQQRKEARERQEERVKVYSLAAGLVVVLLLASLQYRNNRLKQRANEQLQAQKSKTEQQKEKAEQALKDLKATQAQLVQREKMATFGELMAGVAHEIQNPMNFVYNFAEMNDELIAEMQQEMEKQNIAEAQAIANEIKANVQKIIHHGKRADAIVKSMLQHSRQSNSQKEPTDLNALTDEYLRLSYHGLRAKDKSFNATTQTNFDESIGKIEVVPQDMGRALLNLFNNAYYAVNEKKKLVQDGYEPTVLVSTKKQADTIMVTVRDNGTGIPQKVLHKIYQPFFTTKPTGEGTGLGLSLTYDIITKEHGGELKIDSKEGEYTEVVVMLPASLLVKGPA